MIQIAMRGAPANTKQFGPPCAGDTRTFNASPARLPGVLISVAGRAHIYGEKDPVDCLYEIVSGVVRTYKILLDGRRKIAAFYIPGETFGLEGGSQHLFSAEAVTDTKLLVIKRSALVSLAASDSEIARELWVLSNRELERAQNHLLLLIQSAPERVASFLLEMAERIQSNDEMDLPMGRQDIADYLGLTIETVSRVLTKLEKLSAISLPTSKHIVLRDPEALRRLNS